VLAFLKSNLQTVYLYMTLDLHYVDFVVLSLMNIAVPYFAGLTWLMVYRTSKYKKLKSEVEKQSKKCTHNLFINI